MTIKRVLLDIVIFVSVFIFPWWIGITMLLVGIFIFNRYYEFIFFNLFIFSLYAIPAIRIISSPIFFSVIIVFLYILIQYSKNSIILYKK